MTRAELTKQVYQAIGMPMKESDDIVCAIFDSIVRALRSGDKVEMFVYRGLWKWFNQPLRPPVKWDHPQTSLVFGH